MEYAIGTVVIPIYNGLHVARPCVESVVRWTDLTNCRVLLVNDGSDDYTTETLRTWQGWHSSIQLLENPRNLGFVRTCNRAFEHAEGEFVLILNSDTCVTPRWLKKLLECLRSDDSIAMVSPLTNFAAHLRIDMAPGLDYVGMNALLEQLWDGGYPDVTTVAGHCLMIRRSVLAEIGGFDLVFGEGYGEESDLSMRANYFGYRTVCATDTFIYHRGRGSFGASRREMLYRENKVIFHSRWGPRYEAQFTEFRRLDAIGKVRKRVISVLPQLESAFRR